MPAMSKYLIKTLCCLLTLPGLLAAQTPPETASPTETLPAADTEPPTAQLPAVDDPNALDVDAELDRVFVDLVLAESRDPKKSKEAFARARMLVGAVLGLDPYNLRALYYQGRMDILIGKSNLAVTRIQDWNNSPLGRNDWEGHYILGNVYVGMEFYKLAKPSLESAIELNPTEPRPHRLLSVCESKLANRKAAIKSATRYIELLEQSSGIDVDGPLLLAETLIADGQLPRALAVTKIGKKMAMDEVQATGGSVSTLLKAEQYIQLQQNIVQTVLKIKPDDPQAHLDMSKLVQEKGGIGSLRSAHVALVWVFRALELSGDRPSEPIFLDAIGLLTRIGRTNEALAIASRARMIHPISVEIARAYDYLASKAASAADAAPPPGDSPPTAGVQPLP